MLLCSGGQATVMYVCCAFPAVAYRRTLFEASQSSFYGRLNVRRTIPGTEKSDQVSRRSRAAHLHQHRLRLSGGIWSLWLIRWAFWG